MNAAIKQNDPYSIITIGDNSSNRIQLNRRVHNCQTKRLTVNNMLQACRTVFELNTIKILINTKANPCVMYWCKLSLIPM